MGVSQDLASLTTIVTGLAAKVTTLSTDLADHETRLQDALNQLAAANANGASIPELVTLTLNLAQELESTIDAISSWSNNEVSQSYVDGLLP